MKDLKKVAAQLKKEGAEEVNNLVVKNVSLTDKETFTWVTLTLNKEVKTMVADADGNYTVGTNNIVGASLYSIAAVLSNNEDVAFAKNFILQTPEMLSLVLSYASIDILQEPVTEGQEYHNPFSNKEKPYIVKNNSIYNHVIDIRLGKKGQKTVSKLEDKMLDAMVDGSFVREIAKPRVISKDEAVEKTEE